MVVVLGPAMMTARLIIAPCRCHIRVALASGIALCDSPAGVSGAGRAVVVGWVPIAVALGPAMMTARLIIAPI